MTSDPALQPVPEDSASAPAGDVTGLAQIRVEDHDDAAVLSVAGELDISNIDAVRDAAGGLSNRSAGLVLDLAELEYIDSTGISVLYDLAERLRQRSQRLAIVCPPDAQPRRVLDLTGFQSRAGVFEELDDAIAALRVVT